MTKRILTLTLCILISNLLGCANMTGNVVPKKGPTMEDIYNEQGIKGKTNVHVKQLLKASSSQNVLSTEFRKIPNPLLKMYIYPHFAEAEQIPVPGYYTSFNAYKADHYRLPNELVRG